MGKLLAGAKVVRERSDYADFVAVSQDERQRQIESAKEFVKEIEITLKRICDE